MKVNKVPSVSLEILVSIYTSPDNGSVNSKRAHPPQAFVIFGGWKLQKPLGGAGRFILKPHSGAWKIVQMPHPVTTQKLPFPPCKYSCKCYIDNSTFKTVYFTITNSYHCWKFLTKIELAMRCLWRMNSLLLSQLYWLREQGIYSLT